MLPPSHMITPASLSASSSISAYSTPAKTVTPASTSGSYSSRSSIVHPAALISASDPKRCTRAFKRSPYGMGWRIATGFLPAFASIAAIKRVTPDFPHPVLTAHTEITGFEEWSMERSAPRSTKLASSEVTSEALCMRYS